MKENIYDTVKEGDRVMFTGCPVHENGGTLNASLVGRGGTVTQITKDFTGICLYIAHDSKDGEKQDTKNVHGFVNCYEWQWKDFLEFERAEEAPAQKKKEIIRNHDFEVADPVRVISGQHEGRTGHIYRLCSNVFPDYVNVHFCLRKREREVKVHMIEVEHLEKVALHPTGAVLEFIDDFQHGKKGQKGVVAENTIVWKPDNEKMKSYMTGVVLEGSRHINGKQIPSVFMSIELADHVKIIQEPKNNTKMEEKTTLMTIPLWQINESPSNPRKSFEDAYLAELAQSIQEKGVLQPILVRPADGDVYEIVCGARRYRASNLAGIDDIPAIVRDLTDDEAFELQIIENLQRRDVNPMDEAAAFKRMATRNHTVKEMALKVGKSEKYVAQRIKLNELIEPFQEMLFSDRINLTTAHSLCRLSGEFQQDIYEDQCEDWKNNTWKGDFNNLKNIAENRSSDLSKASFDPHDDTLNPEAGSCTRCPHNSANQPELFGDRKHICNNSLCFNKKTEVQFFRELEKAVLDPDVVIVNEGWGNPDKKVVEFVNAHGSRIIGRPDFNEVSEPKKPVPVPSWEEWKQGEDQLKWWGCSFEKLPEEEQQQARESYEDEKEEWKEDLEHYELELKEYREQLESGRLSRAFVACSYGSGLGKYIDIEIESKSAVQSDGNISDTDKVRYQVEAIEAKEARAKELDREKVYKSILEPLGESPFTDTEEKLCKEEIAAVLLALCECDWSIREHFIKSLDIKERWGMKALYEGLLKEASPKKLVWVLRQFAMAKLVNSTETDPERHGKAAAIMDMAEIYVPDELNRARLEQEEKAIKRQERVVKKIEEIKAEKETKS